MDIDTTRVRDLLDKRDEIEAELKEIFTAGKERKVQKCSICQEEGHSARTCPKKPAP